MKKLIKKIRRFIKRCHTYPLNPWEHEYLVKEKEKGLKWIARDKDGGLYTFIGEPYNDKNIMAYVYIDKPINKGPVGSYSVVEGGFHHLKDIESDLFDFVKYEYGPIYIDDILNNFGIVY